jgi:hypothetical protein
VQEREASLCQHDLPKSRKYSVLAHCNNGRAAKSSAGQKLEEAETLRRRRCAGIFSHGRAARKGSTNNWRGVHLTEDCQGDSVVVALQSLARTSGHDPSTTGRAHEGRQETDQ